ncbi:hypothetical protein O3G_MSEX013692 [Manduca sexta]|nr:hypothetical protein O3G_MSEX013692 [Manduca sexta]
MSEVVPNRLLEIMMTYYIDADKRTIEMNRMRFMFEESPYYEQGYVMGEIIERYKKMVEHVKRPMESKADSVFATLKRTELIQKLYFEIFHLVNMAHEIPKKYSYMEEFREMLTQVDLDELLRHEQWIKDNERQRKLNMKFEKKRMQQMRELFLKAKIKSYSPVQQKKYNKWWPIDYGWEIDYYW